jgi:hypothetical protein
LRNLPGVNCVSKVGTLLRVIPRGRESIVTQRKKKRWWMWGTIAVVVLVGVVVVEKLAHGSGTRIDVGRLADVTRPRPAGLWKSCSST